MFHFWKCVVFIFVCKPANFHSVIYVFCSGSGAFSLNIILFPKMLSRNVYVNVLELCCQRIISENYIVPVWWKIYHHNPFSFFFFVLFAFVLLFCCSSSVQNSVNLIVPLSLTLLLSHCLSLSLPFSLTHLF